MWAVVAMLGHWMQNGDVCGDIMSADDGERVETLFGVFGRLFLTALETLDRAGKLNPDSEFRDLGLVTSLYLSWSDGLGDYGFEGECLDWRESVVAYAVKAGIDLRSSGCDQVDRALKDLGEVQPLKPVKKADRWGWKKT